MPFLNDFLFTISALSLAISSNKPLTFVHASNSSLFPFAFPFSAAVSWCAAATIVSSGKTDGWVKYLCLKHTVSKTFSALVAFA